MKHVRHLFLPIVLCSCGGSIAPTGDVVIDLEAEDTITGGLSSGTSEDDVIDGWSIAYTEFVATVGHVHLGRTASGAMVSSPQLSTVDLRSLPTSGFTLASFTALEATRWDVIGFTTPATTSTSTRDATVSSTDFDAMSAGGCTFLIAGALTSDTSQTVDFRLCIPAPTDYGPCSTPDGMSGLAVVASATTPANVTIHGDHLWFNSFPAGAESTVERRAQWMADCDADHDGHVTEAELRAMPASRVFTTTNHYDLAGAPSVDGHGITSAWDWVRAQMTTVGHFQGEGDCPWAAAPSGI